MRLQSQRILEALRLSAFGNWRVFITGAAGRRRGAAGLPLLGLIKLMELQTAESLIKHPR